MKRPPRMSLGRYRSRTAAQAGFSLVAVMIGVSIVSVALVNQAMLAGIGTLVSRQAQNELACRLAALAVIHGPVPAEDGGSVPPARAVAGWHDLVFLDPKTGALLSVVGGEHPAGVTLVSRQYRRGPNGDGRRVLEVTAIAVDERGLPLSGLVAASVSFSVRVR